MRPPLPPPSGIKGPPPPPPKGVKQAPPPPPQAAKPAKASKDAAVSPTADDAGAPSEVTEIRAPAGLDDDDEATGEFAVDDEELIDDQP